MAPSFILESEATSWFTVPTPSTTSASFDAAAGDLLILVAAAAGPSPLTTWSGGAPTNSGAALTWTLVQSSTVASYSPVWAWVAGVDTARTGMTVTLSQASGTQKWGMDLTLWRGGAAVGASAIATGSGAPSLSITTTAASSALLVFNADYNAGSGSSRTWRTGAGTATELVYAYNAGSDATYYGAYHANAGTAGAKTVGLSAPTGQAFTLLAIEITPPTPTPGSDTATLSVTDGATVAVVVSKTASDAAGLSVTDTSSVVAVLSRTDTATLAVTDARTLAGFSARSDAATLAVGDAAYIGGINHVTVSDAPSLTITDTASVEMAATRSGLVEPWDLADQWPTVVRGPLWEPAVSARERTVTGWGELVDQHGTPIPVKVGGVTRRHLPLSGASVTYRGEQTECWSGSVAFVDPWMIPTTYTHPLWGASPVLIRLWWAVWSPEAAAWLPKPVATLAVGDTDATDDGLISGTVAGVDVLSRMIGYGLGAPDVSGMTIDAALATIFARSAPWIQVRIAPTSVVVPDGIVLRDPRSDVAELVVAGYPDGIVRSDCLGIAYAGPRPVPGDAPLDWQEGPGCPVSSIKWQHGVLAMGNQVTAVSTHPDAVGMVVTRQDDDPTSPTYVGGRWGLRPLPTVESSVAATVEALTSIADTELWRGMHPTEDVEVSVPARPDLDGGRGVLLARDRLGVVGLRRVSSWSLSLPGPGLMPVGMIQRRGQ